MIALRCKLPHLTKDPFSNDALKVGTNTFFLKTSWQHIKLLILGWWYTSFGPALGKQKQMNL